MNEKIRICENDTNKASNTMSFTVNGLSETILEIGKKVNLIHGKLFGPCVCKNEDKQQTESINDLINLTLKRAIDIVVALGKIEKSL